jgi:hypothetical protein
VSAVVPVDLTISRPEERRGGDLAVALTLVATGLFVFFWRQPEGVAEAMRLALPDSDDTMRLLGVRDLLAGQGWFDTAQYRYLPPDGVVMHWSRLVDALLAGGIVLLRLVLGAGLAERVFVTAWPLVLFASYAAVLFWGASRLFSLRAAGLAVFAASQMIVFSDLFAPGRIDHHNIQVILVTIAAIGFGLAWSQPRAALASGIALALSLAVGLETLPVVAVIALAFALAWIVRGRKAARSFGLLSASLALASVVAFALQTAPSLWFSPVCDTLSAPWLLLPLGGGAAGLALVAVTPRLSSWHERFGVAAVLGALTLAGFFLLAPECLSGPYQILPEPYRSIWIRDILEAFSFRRFFDVNATAAIQSVAPMLLGGVLATIGAWRAKSAERGLLALLAGLLWLGVVLAQFQIRTVYITSAVLPLVAGWFVDRVLSSAREPGRTPVRVGSAVCAVLMFGFTWAAGVAVAETWLRGAGIVRAKRVACQDPAYVSGLAALPKGVVLNQVDLGPNVLLHTPHSIVVAGYHRAVSGIIAGVDAFNGREADMRRVADEFHVDYLVVCRAWFHGSDGASRPFARELAEGRPVSWLRPLALDAGPLKAWEVVR